MLTYKLSKYAEKDIEQILAYTIETWGIRQFHTYRELITDALKIISADPDTRKFRNREALFPGCRSYPFGKHIIFFRIKNEAIEIVRILHQKMDFSAHIPKDYQE